MADKINFTSESLLNTEFKPNVKGYDAEQVDETLDKIIADLKVYEKFYAEAKDYILELETKLTNYKQTVEEQKLEIAKLNNRLGNISGNKDISVDNIEYIKKIRTLEKKLYDHGIDPNEIK